MRPVHLVHAGAAEVPAALERLRAAGHHAVHVRVEPRETMRAWSAEPPAAIVIDLSRLPSFGRQVAWAIRGRKATRPIPIVFAGGEPEKVARLRGELPDAGFASWGRIGPALDRAIARPPSDPVVPGSKSGPYSGTPLPRKLGIGPGATVALDGAPEGFATTLGELPEGARLVRRTSSRPDVLLWFVRSRAELERGIRKAARGFAGKGGLWIAWPKKGSELAGDVDGNLVRAVAATAGLVDFKVCAIDATWSGHRFSVRAKPKGR